MLAAEAVGAADGGIAIPAGAEAGASTGVGGALATTDAEGSEGSEAGIATALAGDVIETEGAASCGFLEQAESANNNANGRRNRADFMGGLLRVLNARARRVDVAARMQGLQRCSVRAVPLGMCSQACCCGAEIESGP